MNAPNTIEEHRHRFAVWAAARAASRRMKNFKVELASELIECASLKGKIGDPELLPSPSEVDASHAERREMMIQRAKTRAEISHGRAAKLINVYPKAAFVCGGYHEHLRILR
jgi:hypothetical protein